MNVDSAYFQAEFSESLKRVATLTGEPATRFLEIGYGNGALLEWAASRGFRCYGVEIEPDLLEAAQARGVETFASVHSALGSIGPGTVGLVAAFDALEHMTHADLVACLRCVEKLLAPGGVFVARFPNGDSPFGLRLQNGDLTHATAIGSLKMAGLAALAGLTILEIRNAALPPVCSPAALIRRSVANGLRAAIEHAVRSLYHLGRATALGSNLVAILQKPLRSDADR